MNVMPLDIFRICIRINYYVSNDSEDAISVGTICISDIQFRNREFSSRMNNLFENCTHFTHFINVSFTNMETNSGVSKINFHVMENVTCCVTNISVSSLLRVLSNYTRNESPLWTWNCVASVVWSPQFRRALMFFRCYRMRS
jgi:predicted GTPase